MAAPTNVELVRLLAGITEVDYDNDFVSDLIDRSGSEYGAVSLFWQIRAAGYAKSVGIASGSTRIELQQRYEHAIERAEYYEGLAGGISDSVATMISVTMAKAFEDDDTEYTWGEGGWPSAGMWAAWERQF